MNEIDRSTRRILVDHMNQFLAEHARAQFSEKPKITIMFRQDRMWAQA